MRLQNKEQKWRPHSWLGEYLGRKKLSECIIVTKPKKGKKK